ncbi:MAG: DUF6092 family protein [Chloroflexi bacterium]|nr:DUF6092 family protein [Chloroflexota bacterium]
MKEDFYKILSFCISSAIGCVNEPSIYGPLRLIEAMEKFIDFGIENGITTHTEMDVLSEYIVQNKTLCMVDEEEFTKSLKETAYILIDKQMKSNN